MQHRAGMRAAPVSTAATGMTKLAGLAGDARMLFRLWGLLPIVQWLTAIERNPPPTRKLLTIERFQGWAMLAYYPLEHTYYMLAHDIIPATFALPTLASLIPFVASKPSGKLVTLNRGAFALWSCRFWAAYILLQFVHLKEDFNLLKMREKAVGKSKAISYPAEKEELRKRWDAFWGEVVVNAGYLPQALHWSLEAGLFKNDAWINVFGLIAGLAAWRNGWKATALPPAPADAPAAAPELEKAPVELGAVGTPLDLDIEAPMLDEM
ncbi:uncharacterized protein B0H18DRAFT_1042614 [Fomitopsis serialis]|uniref:uncharacterized protein n=1 Tax=Fomitopsis serialis TaxID=139415 RepID=UPI002008890E|nr:uncharacterized protein B0H18DRAFT_1042614 [Neoantrodia serialis]KAH9915117.1 hypothetical protein B0H18DRAFT_1042614 [Neoantrodia serialis]